CRPAGERPQVIVIERRVGGRIDVLRQEAGAIRDRVDGTVGGQIPRERGNVLDVQNDSQSDALLNAQREVVNSRRLAIPVVADGRVRSKKASAVQERVQVAVIVCGRVVDGRQSRLGFIAQQLILSAEASANGGLAVPENVPGKTKARLEHFA